MNYIPDQIQEILSISIKSTILTRNLYHNVFVFLFDSFAYNI